MLHTFDLKLAGDRRKCFLISARAVLTLAVGMSITVAISLWMHWHEQHLEDSYFEQRASAHVLAFQQQLGESIQALELVNQSFNTFAPVSREQFRAFTEPLLAHYPYVLNFSFHRLVSKNDRAAYEAEMRKYDPDFSVIDITHGARIPAPVRESYRVITYLEPMAGNEVVFGLDVPRFTRGQDEAIRRASRTGKASATRLFELPQKGDESGFGIVMPVYRQGANAPPGESRPEDIVGYTLANFRAADFVGKILGAADLLMVPANISVYVGDRADESGLVYQKGGLQLPEGTTLPISERLLHDRPNAFVRTLDFAGTPWHIAISAPLAPFTQHHLGSLFALLGGVFVTFLAALSMQTLALRSHRTQQLVDERTAELKVANQLLIEDIAAREQTEQRLKHTKLILMNAQKIAHVGSWVFDVKTRELECSDEFFRICGLEPQSVKASIEFSLSIVHPDDLDAAKQAIATAMKEGKEYKIEKRIVRPDGSIRYIASRGELFSNEAHERQFFVGSFLDVTDQKKTEFALRESQNKLRELAAHLERIREDERKRIAREIHDELGALLTAIKAHLSVAIDTAAGAGAQTDTLLTDAAQLVDVATEAVRRVVADLRPSVLDQLGVWAALEWYVDGIEERTQLRCQCVIDSEVAETELCHERSAMVFRIVQEALTNVVRHANASRATVHVTRQENFIIVVIEDDGKGLDPAHLLDRRSWGIVGMHERARYFGGKLTITGTPGRGTTVALRLPLEDSDG